MDIFLLFETLSELNQVRWVYIFAIGANGLQEPVIPASCLITFKWLLITMLSSCLALLLNYDHIL